VTIYEQIKNILNDRIGSTVTASEIKHALKAKFGTNASSIIPSDYCYNRINDGIKFEKHIFEYIDHNIYKYLGERYPFTGLIFHKPTGQTNELIYGEWNNGRKIIYKTPVVQDSIEGIRIRGSFAKMDVPKIIKENTELKESITQDNSNILPQLRSRHQIFALINRADDYEETKRLINKLDGLKKTRTPYYLNINELDEIFHWKLRRQYYRQIWNIKENTDDSIRTITKAAFSVSSSDERKVIELMLKTLIKLHGVQTPVASAIMTLSYPERYCVIDYRGWRQMYGEDKKYQNYSVKEYLVYWTKITTVAKKFGVTPQEVDMATWQYDIENYNMV